jgi:hypothetical protein
MLKRLFPKARFFPPATEDTIAAAEATLGVSFPVELRSCYLECDGFREDKGNAKYLFSLFEEDFIGSVVTTTRFLWTGVAADLKSFVFFGSSCADYYWGIDVRRPMVVIAYHHHMGDKYEVVGSSIVDVWRADYAFYDQVS